jgi:hypothetical protein
MLHRAFAIAKSVGNPQARGRAQRPAAEISLRHLGERRVFSGDSGYGHPNTI